MPILNNSFKYGNYHCDIVFCIDASKSMAPVINNIKDFAKLFYQKFLDGMEMVDKEVECLRCKVIAFRNYKYDNDPMVESPFYTIPEQKQGFESFLNCIEARGGDGGAENALEAIALALKSNWTTGGFRQRHIIVLFTDAPAVPLGDNVDCVNYSKDMPEDLSELSRWWEGVSPIPEGTYLRRAGRMIAFVPNAEPWIDLQVWNRYWPVFGGIPSDDNLEIIMSLLVGGF